MNDSHFKILRKCKGKFDSLVFKMFYIKKFKPNLNLQKTNSIRFWLNDDVTVTSKHQLFSRLNLRVILRNVLSQFFIIICFSKLRLLRNVYLIWKSPLTYENLLWHKHSCCHTLRWQKPSSGSAKVSQILGFNESINCSEPLYYSRS